MARRTYVLLTVCVCLLGLHGCSSLPRQLAPPRAEVMELRIVQAGFDGQRFAVRLDLFNPNAVSTCLLLDEWSECLPTFG